MVAKNLFVKVLKYIRVYSDILTMKRLERPIDGIEKCYLITN